MKRIFHVFCGLLAVILSLTSCLGSSDSDITTYNDVAIKSFSLGKLNRYIHTTTTSGADSVYKSTFTASSYKMNIDQLKHTISNADSLPIVVKPTTMLTDDNQLMEVEYNGEKKLAFNFGKYREVPLDILLVVDRQYLQWVLGTNMCNQTKKIISDLLNNQTKVS